MSKEIQSLKATTHEEQWLIDLLQHGNEMYEENRDLMQTLFEDSAAHTQHLLHFDPQQDYGCTPDSVELVKKWILKRRLDSSITPALFYLSLNLRSATYDQYGLMLQHRPLFGMDQSCEDWEREITATMLLHSVPQTLRVTLGLWDTLIALVNEPKRKLGTNFLLHCGTS